MKGCDYMAFKDRLKAARKKSGLTQLDIAKKIGLLNAQSYAQYEQGKRKPKQDTLNKIADALQLSYGYASNGEPYFYCFVDSVHGEEYKENEKFNNNQYMDAITSIPDGKIHIPGRDRAHGRAGDGASRCHGRATAQDAHLFRCEHRELSSRP